MRKLLLITFVFTLALVANAKNPKISPDTSTSTPGTIDVIVQFKHVPGATHRAKVASRGGVVKTDLSLIKSLHVSLKASELVKLANDPEVAFISPNRIVKNHLNNATEAVVAPYAWSLGLDGTGRADALSDP